MESLNIIIFEDENIAIQALIHMLKGYSHNPSSFKLPFKNKSENNVFESLKGKDLIIMDIRLQSESGIIIMEEIRKLGIDIPVIFMTGYLDEDISKKISKIKNSFYLTKPINIHDLLMTIQSAYFLGGNYEKLFKV